MTTDPKPPGKNNPDEYALNDDLIWHDRDEDPDASQKKRGGKDTTTPKDGDAGEADGNEESGDKNEGGDKNNGGDKPAKKMSATKRYFLIIGGILFAVLAAIGILLWWLHARQYENTDDAFIDVHMVRIAPQISGRVLQVLVDDNQNVHQGDVLVEIDPADYQARLDQAIATEKVASAEVEEAQAEVDVAEANAVNAATQLQRNRQLVHNQLISNQQLDNFVAQARSSAANLEAAQKKENSAEANVKSASAETEQARLNLSYTRIVATEDGHIAEKNIANGDYVQVGQNAMSLVPLNVWVTANFKETQLDQMQPGQPVDIEIDAYPDQHFKGHVDSVQSGGGGAFSLLPPENSTGNYVKIVQRVPVKIVFDQEVDPKFYLGPGMSVVPTVKVR